MIQKSVLSGQRYSAPRPFVRGRLALRLRGRCARRLRQHAFAVGRRARDGVAMLTRSRRRIGRALEQARLAPPAARKTIAERMQAEADDRAARKTVDADAIARGAG